MNQNTPNLTTTASEQYYCVVCGHPVEVAVQPDYRIGFEGTSYTILTCPQPQSKCKIGQATASLRRLENGEFQIQWRVQTQFDLITGEAL